LTPQNPAAFSFKIFLNYDGSGGQFGNTSVSAASGDPDQLSIFAAQRTDSALTVLVLNKTTSPITDSITLANFLPAGTAQVWQYSSANLSAIERQPDVSLGGTTVTADFPAYSMTLLVIPQSSGAMSVAQPSVYSVTNAASYNSSGIAPGEIVTIFGQGMGPAQIANLQEDSNGLVSTSTGKTMVYFNGIAAPMIYALANQVSAVVPYEMAQYTNVNVVVEYSGNASNPFSVKIVSAIPGIFTANSSGTGQGAITNARDSTPNNSANPAARGDYVTIYATGEGSTNPPVVDGKVTAAPLQTPVLPCSAMIGGVAATIQYCGAAPGETSGLLQVNAQVPQSVAPGSSVPVAVVIGQVTSTPGVTMAVK
jgi:trimeric autotransporter adhesin